MSLMVQPFDSAKRQKENMQFDENKHPRDDDGKFTDKDFFRNAEDTIKKEKQKAAQELVYALDKVNDLKSLLGEEFKGYKGQAAVNKLVKEQRGHIKAAFHRDDIGDIDLIWGNDYLGLQHIIKQREEQGINSQQFLSDIAETVEKSKFLKMGNNGTLEFWYNRKSVVISQTYHENKITYLLTAFKKTLNKSRVPK